MTEANAQRHRERLVMSLDEDGLEDLTLRIARRDYPQAHSTRRGQDGGVDIFSDHGTPPQRGWQSKNYTDNAVDWSKCKRSLTSAIKNETPRQYTFVFPRLLNKTEHDYWRDTFVPWALKAFPGNLPELDYWDDLPDRIADRPELVNRLNDGALATYIRQVLSQTAETGVNPVATAADHLDDPAKLAERAIAMGRNDPYYAYGGAGREANAADDDLAQNTARFRLDAAHEDALPRYALSIRHGNSVHEITAAPREAGAPRPQLWFAGTPEGAQARERARLELAKGRTVTLEGPDIGLSATPIPDGFRDFAGEGDTLRNGKLTVGLSEPVVLTVTMMVGDATIREEIRAYRIPELPGDRAAYGGAVGGIILSLDLRPIDGIDNAVNTIFSATGAFGGETPSRAVHGFAFARAFSEADSTLFVCPGVLPPDGLTIRNAAAVAPEVDEALRMNEIVALALETLERRDPRDRTMPDGFTRLDLEIARRVLTLDEFGELRKAVTEPEFPVPLPAGAQLDDDPTSWLSYSAALPDIAGRPVGMTVTYAVENATALELVPMKKGRVALRCRNDGGAAVVAHEQPAPETAAA